MIIIGIGICIYRHGAQPELIDTWNNVGIQGALPPGHGLGFVSQILLRFEGKHQIQILN